jgi:hypothetical protein
MEMKTSDRIFSEFDVGGVATAPWAGAETFLHPDDVVNDARLTKAEKKALLASWCSDARAVENAPSLRRLDSGAVIGIDAILQALRALDGDTDEAKGNVRWFAFGRHRQGAISRWLTKARSPTGSDDDDDDPPPAPAGIAIPFKPTFVAAHAARPEILGGAAPAAA